MKTMAICWIGIGEYNTLFDGMYASFTEKFCVDFQKTFFIFTDRPDLYRDVKNSVVYEISNACTHKEFVLFRKFKYLMMAEDRFLGYEYVAFVNGNMCCNTTVHSQDVISQDKPLAVITHPCHMVTRRGQRNCDHKSLASFCPESDWPYLQSGFIVTTSREFLKMSNTIEGWRCLDKASGNDKYVPWHDETYVNRYYYENRQKLNILDGRVYAYPQDMDGQFKQFEQCKIYTRSKKDLLKTFRPPTRNDLY